MFSIFAVLEGIISSVPKALELYHEIAPLLSQNADIHPDQIAKIEAMAPIAHDAVAGVHDAIATIAGVYKTDPVVAAVPPVTPAAAV